jgi:hypothetical protein
VRAAGALGRLPQELSQCPQFLAGERVHARGAILAAPDVQLADLKVDIVPAQPDDLAGRNPCL